MTQIGETAFTDAVAHSKDMLECPFCPKNKETFTTHGGAANDSQILGDVMGTPDSLTGKQGGARPKDGKTNRQSPDPPKPKPAPIFTHAVYGDYSSEAHHIIPGNQSMKGSAIEDWLMSSKGKIAADTGYSINNAANGVWLPSIPEKYRNGSWGSMEFSKKLEIAAAAMQSKGQFHKGHHNIGDPDDPSGVYHQRYSEKIQGELDDLADLISGWSVACFEAKKTAPPYDPNWKVHGMIDALGRGIAANIGSPIPKAWRYYISRISLEFHKNSGCACNVG